MSVRRQLVESQGGKCCYCKRPFTNTGLRRATIEHKKARMDGGSNELSNLAAACFHCNQHRGHQMNYARQTVGRRKPQNT
jgi:5-methylcytosine-specific restriction endonuclease McrA